MHAAHSYPLQVHFFSSCSILRNISSAAGVIWLRGDRLIGVRFVGITAATLQGGAPRLVELARNSILVS